jgi:hypothetical protein
MLRADDSSVPPSPQFHSMEPQSASPARLVAAHDGERPPVLSSSTSERTTYTGWLVAAYATTPLLWWGVGWSASELELSPALVVAALVIGSAWPATVHWAHGEVGLGFRSFAFTVVTAAAAFTGLLVGSAVGGIAAPDDAIDDHLGMAAVFGVLFGALGAFGWAHFDVTDSARERRSSRPASRSALGAMVVPRADGALGVVAGTF